MVVTKLEIVGGMRVRHLHYGVHEAGKEFVGLIVFAAVTEGRPFISQNLADVDRHGFADFGVGVGIEIVAETEQIVELVAFAHDTILDFGELAPDNENGKREQDGVNVAYKLDQDVEAFRFASGEVVEAHLAQGSGQD
jgi:hypothetical protein